MFVAAVGDPSLDRGLLQNGCGHGDSWAKGQLGVAGRNAEILHRLRWAGAAIFVGTRTARNPSQLALVGVRAVVSCLLSFSLLRFNGNFGWLSERKLQMALRSYRYVLFCFGRFGVTGVFGWGFAGAIDWLGGQLVGLAFTSTDVRATVNSAGPDFLTDTTRPATWAPLGRTVLPSTLMGEERMAAKESPEWFLLLARAWLTVARTAVPLGTVTKVVCCVDLLETTLLETGLADGVLLEAVLFEAVWLKRPRALVLEFWRLPLCRTRVSWRQAWVPLVCWPISRLRLSWWRRRLIGGLLGLF